MKSFFYLVLFSICLQSCLHSSSKYYYSRISGEKIEELQIDQKRNQFHYKSEIQNEGYSAVGEIIQTENERFSELVFPYQSELVNHSPFEKASSFFTKIGDSKKIQIYVTKSSTEDMPYFGGKGCRIISKLDDSVVEIFRSDTLILSKIYEGDRLVFGGFVINEYSVEIPEPGIYNLHVTLQENYSFVSYAVGSKGCIPEISYPQKNLWVCEVKNEIPVKVDFVRYCDNPFELKVLKNGRRIIHY